MARAPGPRGGWLVLFPIFLRHAPENPEVIVARAADLRVCENDPYCGLYGTEPETWAAAREHLEQARDRAQKEISLLTKLSGRPDGPIPKPNAANLARWTDEVREARQIAEMGLQLCDSD